MPGNVSLKSPGEIARCKGGGVFNGTSPPRSLQGGGFHAHVKWIITVGGIGVNGLGTNACTRTHSLARYALVSPQL